MKYTFSYRDNITKLFPYFFSTDCINELPNVADGIRDTGKITSWDDREDPVKLCFSVMKGHLMGRSTRIITSRQILNQLFYL